MPENSTTLSKIFEGWDGYQTSIYHAIEPLTHEQLIWRPAPKLRSVGELTSHIAMGRINWFVRMPAPGSRELKEKLDSSGSETAIAIDKDKIVHWLEVSWQMISDTLNQWTVNDLLRTYRQEYWGKVYVISYQWTIWRILAHDLHHGGELGFMLGMQGIGVPELGDLGGHLTQPPLAEDS